MSLAPNLPPPDVSGPLQEFTDRHGLAPLIESAKQLAEHCFTLDVPVLIRKVDDPESGDEWVEMRVRARGEIADVGKAHDEYTRRWLELVPANKALMIRLAIRIA